MSETQPPTIIITPTIADPSTTTVSSTIVSSSLASPDTDTPKTQTNNNSINNNVSSTTKSTISTKTLLNENLINVQLKDVSSRIELVSDLKIHLTPTWSGKMALKKLTFMTNFYLLAGNPIVSDQILPNSSESNNLHISQRLRLDSTKLDDIEKRLYDTNLNQSLSSDKVPFSLFLLLPESSSSSTTTTVDVVASNSNQPKSLQSLIYYLDQKSAAGVIPMPDEVKPVGNVYVFTPASSFAARILKQILPSLKFRHDGVVSAGSGMSDEQLVFDYSDFLVVVILKFNN